jgi:hypothetical protein
MTSTFNIQLEFERLDGELDAAMVFAAAAEEQYCANQPEFGELCRSDADDLYTKAWERISPEHLPEDQQHLLAPKLECLKLILERLWVLRLSMRHEAAQPALSVGHA